MELHTDGRTDEGTPHGWPPRTKELHTDGRHERTRHHVTFLNLYINICQNKPKFSCPLRSKVLRRCRGDLIKSVAVLFEQGMKPFATGLCHCMASSISFNQLDVLAVPLNPGLQSQIIYPCVAPLLTVFVTY